MKNNESYFTRMEGYVSRVRLCISRSTSPVTTFVNLRELANAEVNTKKNISASWSNILRPTPRGGETVLSIKVQGYVYEWNRVEEYYCIENFDITKERPEFIRTLGKTVRENHMSEVRRAIARAASRFLKEQVDFEQLKRMCIEAKSFTEDELETELLKRAMKI